MQKSGIHHSESQSDLASVDPVSASQLQWQQQHSTDFISLSSQFAGHSSTMTGQDTQEAAGPGPGAAAEQNQEQVWTLGSAGVLDCDVLQCTQLMDLLLVL